MFVSDVPKIATEWRKAIYGDKISWILKRSSSSKDSGGSGSGSKPAITFTENSFMSKVCKPKQNYCDLSELQNGGAQNNNNNFIIIASEEELWEKSKKSEIDTSFMFGCKPGYVLHDTLVTTV